MVYSSCYKFLEYSQKSPRDVNYSDVKGYLETLIVSRKSSSTINLAYSALYFYFGRVLRRKFFVHIPRVKKEKKLPVVLTREEVLQILGVVTNVKHKLILATMYSSGL
uniref:Integrase SAM-like N-terminal domain-containing protein n=1 Tax=candidate division CPR3 bacterium TaxID=2268181 RepID=A0A7C4RAY1_UNCC3